MARLGGWMVNCAFGLFLALYVYVVAAYGLTRDSDVKVFEILAGIAFALWLTGYILQRTRPNIPFWPWLIISTILLFGWTVTVLGAINDAIIDNKLPSWNGFFPDWVMTYCVSFDSKASLQAMACTSALLGTTLMAIDFWGDHRRGKFIIWTIILSATALTLFFFLQKIVGSPFVLHSLNLGWTPRGWVPATLAFGTYRYHGNAADYLNMAWPTATAVAIFAIFRQTKAWPLWFLPFAAMFIATFLNVSKAGNVLAILGIVLFLALLIPFVIREIKRSRKRIPTSKIIAALVPIVIIAVAIPFALPWQRWELYITDTNSHGRLTAYKEFIKMIPDAGFAGFGPGTFSSFYSQYLENTPLQGLGYDIAHQDYLQTIIEWGYAGTVLWGLLLIPPFWFLFKATKNGSTRPSRGFEGYRISISDHVRAAFESIPGPKESIIAVGVLTSISLVALHAMGDFPMQIPSLQFYFLNLIALGWSYTAREKLPEE